MDDTLQALSDIIAARRAASAEQSYVASLLHAPVDKVLKKIGEEAAETIIAAKGGVREEIIYESADLLFHLLVMLEHQGIWRCQPATSPRTPRCHQPQRSGRR